MHQAMSQLSMHLTQPSYPSRPNSRSVNRYQTRPTVNVHPADTQAELIAFTPSLMSLQFPPQGYRGTRMMNYRSSRPHVQNSPSFASARTTEPSTVPQKSHSETTLPPPEYYVDSFASNFSDTPSSSHPSRATAKHVTFEEPARIRLVVSC